MAEATVASVAELYASYHQEGRPPLCTSTTELIPELLRIARPPLCKPPIELIPERWRRARGRVPPPERIVRDSLASHYPYPLATLRFLAARGLSIRELAERSIEEMRRQHSPPISGQVSAEELKHYSEELAAAEQKYLDLLYDEMKLVDPYQVLRRRQPILPTVLFVRPEQGSGVLIPEIVVTPEGKIQVEGKLETIVLEEEQDGRKWATVREKSREATLIFIMNASSYLDPEPLIAKAILNYYQRFMNQAQDS